MLNNYGIFCLIVRYILFLDIKMFCNLNEWASRMRRRNEVWVHHRRERQIWLSVWTAVLFFSASGKVNSLGCCVGHTMSLSLGTIHRGWHPSTCWTITVPFILHYFDSYQSTDILHHLHQDIPIFFCNLSNLGLNEWYVILSVLLSGDGFSPTKKRRNMFSLFTYFSDTDELNVL